MTLNLTISTAVLYILSICFYIGFLYVDKRLLGRAATLCLAAAVVLHFLKLLERARLVHAVPYQDFYGSMSLFAWFLAVTYLGLEVFHRQRAVGPFVLPLVLVLVAASSWINSSRVLLTPPARGPLFAMHVTSNMLAYAAFALAFVMSLLYLAQNRVLKRRNPGTAFWRFPALETLERMSRSSVLVGLFATCIGMVFGFVWVHRKWGTFWISDPKAIVTIAVILMYVLYLRLSSSASWRGARASILCIGNFLLVLFSYTLVNLYLSRFHRYF